MLQLFWRFPSFTPTLRSVREYHRARKSEQRTVAARARSTPFRFVFLFSFRNGNFDILIIKMSFYVNFSGFWCSSIYQNTIYMIYVTPCSPRIRSWRIAFSCCIEAQTALPGSTELPNWRSMHHEMHSVNTPFPHAALMLHIISGTRDKCFDRIMQKYRKYI